MQPTSDPQSAGSDELAPGTDVGGYIVESKIGEGGMGLVYGAQHPRIGKRVAIKVLAPKFCRDPAVVQRFEQEARLVNAIRHSNIVDVFQLGELPDGRKYLVMEWLVGESLSDLIDRGPVPIPHAVEILDAIADALEAVHETGVVHRDLKSDNVFLQNHRGQQQVKLLDFGLAKLSHADPGSITKTKTGMIVGTPSYMAPEQARGRAIDGRLDIYALGVLAYKILIGKLPFTGQPYELLIAHLKTPPPPAIAANPAIPIALSDLIVRMMAKEPAGRPTLAEMRGVFADVRAGRTTPAPSRPVAGTAPSADARPTIHYVLIGLGVVLAAVIAFVMVRLATQ